MEDRIRNAAPDESWANRGALAVKMGALLTVLFVIALAGTHMPMSDDAAPEHVAAPAGMAVAPADPATYFPSQYRLNAPEPGEPAPTF